MKSTSLAADSHPFLRRPNRTILYLSLPILISLIAEPVTGLVDTGFVARLGAVPLAALGVGTTALTSIFWIFGFLGIATQTEVAQIFGRGEAGATGKTVSLSLALGLGASLLLSGLLFPGAAIVSAALGGEGEVLRLATHYIQARLLGAPAVIIVVVGFGALRGIQDMRTPLWIALGINLANIILDYVLIFGWWVIPALGVTGAAIASSLSQWLGAVWMIRVLHRRLGLSRGFNLRDGISMLRIGRDLVIRTGSLALFTLFATRVATQMGAEAGAAHQVIRQVWFFTALALDAFSNTAQSLVGFFYGSGRADYAKRVALSTSCWSLATGIVLMLGMLLATNSVAAAFVPPSAQALFHHAWILFALSQPLNALAFITDGIHWGTSDYRYLRNGMIIATACGLIGLQLVAAEHPEAFTGVWLVIVMWVAMRAFWGLLRLFPGIGHGPLRAAAAKERSR